MKLDIDRVASRLHQGGRVDETHHYPEFSMIVLCAREIQPAMSRFGGKVIHAPFDDTHSPTERDLARAVDAACAVVREITIGGRVLVTCSMGWNRSGLVVGLALNQLTGLPAHRIVELIRKARGEDALSNQTFERIVRGCNRVAEPSSRRGLA